MQRINFPVTFKNYIELLPPNCVHSAIFASDGSIYSSSENWTFTSEDGKKIAKLMYEPLEAMKGSIELGQRSYLVAYADHKTLVARKREFGIMVVKAKMDYVLGYCDGTVDPKKCLESVKRVADLMSKSSIQPPSSAPSNPHSGRKKAQSEEKM